MQRLYAIPRQFRRNISQSFPRQWDEIRSHNHPQNILNTFIHSPPTVSIIGAPMTYGQPLLGTDTGPEMLRDAGLLQALIELGYRVKENGNLSFAPPSLNDPRLDPALGIAKQCFAVGNGLQKIQEIVHQTVSDGNFSLVLGGDHTIGCGSVAGILSVHLDAGIIWVDAHADINTPMTSGSGNMHGMPLAFLIPGLIDSSKIPGMEWLTHGPRLLPEQLVYIGLRDVDAGERQIIQDLDIKAFSMQQVDKYGIGKTMEMALDHLCGKKQRPLHMSYDIDAVDPMIAPSTGTKVRGGLTWREAHYVAEAVAETNCLVGLDLVEVNPSLAPGHGSASTVEMGLVLISSALGNRIL